MSSLDDPNPGEAMSTAFARGALTRRDLLRLAGMASMTVAGAGVLAACGGSSSSSSGSSAAASAAPATSASYPKTVASSWTWANGPEYIDTKGSRHPSLDLFDKQFKTHTNYLEVINDQAEFFGKVEPALAAHQSTGYDMVFATDWMAGKWIGLGYVDPLDRSLLPNVEANQLDALRGRSIDPHDAYLVPWQSGSRRPPWISTRAPSRRSVKSRCH